MKPAAERRITFRASDDTYHSVPACYIDKALEIDPELVILLTSAADPNTLALTATDCVFLWAVGIKAI